MYRCDLFTFNRRVPHHFIPIFHTTLHRSPRLRFRLHPRLYPHVALPPWDVDHLKWKQEQLPQLLRLYAAPEYKEASLEQKTRRELMYRFCVQNHIPFRCPKMEIATDFNHFPQHFPTLVFPKIALFKVPKCLTWENLPLAVQLLPTDPPAPPTGDPSDPNEPCATATAQDLSPDPT